MTIQWFPGHMAKARREIEEQLKHVDVVLELVDARLPESSRNPILEAAIAAKPRVLILNKADLADPLITKQWLTYYQHQQMPALAVNAVQDASLRQHLVKVVTPLLAEKFSHDQQRGIQNRGFRAMCLGVPNVGKSTFINHLVGKNIAQTGNKPGVTKKQNWLQVKGAFELLDTPGVLWPKFDNTVIGNRLALSGAIKDSLFHADDVALFLINELTVTYPSLVARYLKVDVQTAKSEFPELAPNVAWLMAATARAGLRDDYDRFADKMRFDFRKGKLGAISLDRPEEAVHGDVSSN